MKSLGSVEEGRQKEKKLQKENTGISFHQIKKELVSSRKSWRKE